MGKTDKHSRTEAWKPTIFAGLDFLPLSVKEKHKGMVGGEGGKHTEAGKKKISPATCFFSKKL